MELLIQLIANYKVKKIFRSGMYEFIIFLTPIHKSLIIPTDTHFNREVKWDTYTYTGLTKLKNISMMEYYFCCWTNINIAC